MSDMIKEEQIKIKRKEKARLKKIQNDLKLSDKEFAKLCENKEKLWLKSEKARLSKYGIRMSILNL